MLGRVLQQSDEGIGRHPTITRQARAVINGRRRDAVTHFSIPPLSDFLSRGVKSGGLVGGHRQGQKNLLRHHVVAELVDVHDDVSQRQRRRAVQQLGGRRHAILRDLTRQTPSDRLPDA